MMSRCWWLWGGLILVLCGLARAATDCVDLPPGNRTAVLACDARLVAWAADGSAVAEMPPAGVVALAHGDAANACYAAAPGALYGVTAAGTLERLLSWRGRAHPAFLALAVGHGLAAISDDGTLRLFDLERRRPLRRHRVPALRGIALADDGRLLALTNRQLVSYAVDPRTGALSDRRVIIADGLENPRRVLIGPCKVKYFITDWGSRHQVLIYGVNGKLERTIGPQYAGLPGDPGVAFLDHPDGLAITRDGTLWVAEAARVSRWRIQDGTCLGTCR
jgi:hypothetical protein